MPTSEAPESSETTSMVAPLWHIDAGELLASPAAVGAIFSPGAEQGIVTLSIAPIGEVHP